MRFEVEIPGGALRGDHSGEGAPALLLHGGAAVEDYLGELAAELEGLFSTFRYTQRGTPPSTGGPPFTGGPVRFQTPSPGSGFEKSGWIAGGHGFAAGV